MKKPHRRLTVRSREGSDIRALQSAANRRLKARGLGRYAVEVDSVVGAKTIRAVRKAAWALGARRHTLRQLKNRVSTRVISIGVQRMIRYPGRRLPVQRARGASRLRELKRARARRKAGVTSFSRDWSAKHFHCYDRRAGGGGKLLYRMPQKNYPAARRHCRKTLQPLTNLYGQGYVLSGYRPKPYNVSIKGARYSYHRYELRSYAIAADVRFKHGSPKAWYDYAVLLGTTGVIKYSWGIHCDNRKGRYQRG